MLIGALDEIRGHSGIEGAVAPIGHKVNARLSLPWHETVAITMHCGGGAALWIASPSARNDGWFWARDTLLQSQPRHLDGGTAIHHDIDAVPLGLGRCRIITHAQLHPDDPRALGNGFIDNWRDQLRAAKDIDHVDGALDLGEARDDRFAVNVLARGLRIDRN